MTATEKMTGLEIVQALIRDDENIRSRFDNNLGYVFKEASQGTLIMEMDIDPDIHFGPFKHVHGAVLAAFATSAAAFTTLTMMPAGKLNDINSISYNLHRCGHARQRNNYSNRHSPKIRENNRPYSRRY